MDLENLRNTRLIEIPKRVVVEIGTYEVRSFDADSYKMPTVGEFIHLYKNRVLVASVKKIEVRSIYITTGGVD